MAMMNGYAQQLQAIENSLRPWSQPALLVLHSPSDMSRMRNAIFISQTLWQHHLAQLMQVAGALPEPSLQICRQQWPKNPLGLGKIIAAAQSVLSTTG